MENKTAVEIAIESLQPLTNQILTEDSWLITSVTKLMRDHASLQCAEMKEELESWKKEHFETVEMAAANLKELQEEVERLRGIINEAGIITGKDAERFQKNMDEATRKALSGKESKTDGSYPGDDGANMGRGQY